MKAKTQKAKPNGTPRTLANLKPDPKNARRFRLAPPKHAICKAGVFVIHKPEADKSRKEPAPAKPEAPAHLVSSARELLKLVRRQTGALLIPFSAGKDSSAVLDLAVDLFPRVQPYYLYRVAGLAVMEGSLRRTEVRYGLSIVRLPHPDLSEVFANALLQPHWTSLDVAPRKVTMPEVEAYVRAETGIDWVASGKRCSDSLPRRAALRQCGGIDFDGRRCYPVWLWNRRDVLSYLAAKRIPTPLEFGRKEQGGLDFHLTTMRFLKENHPDDWQRYCRVFPFAEAAILSADLRRADSPQGDQTPPAESEDDKRRVEEST